MTLLALGIEGNNVEGIVATDGIEPSNWMYYLTAPSKTSRTASESSIFTPESLVIYIRCNRVNDGSSLSEGRARRLLITWLQAQAAKCCIDLPGQNGHGVGTRLVQCRGQLSFSTSTNALIN